MPTQAQIKLWGTTIGAVLLDEEVSDAAVFQYEPDFLRSGVQVAPLTMPLNDRPYTFPGLSRQTFHGLPGLLADSLPDRYGTTLINAWLDRQGRRPGDFNSVERLCYVGRRGIGALEFEPGTGLESELSERVDVAGLVELASEVLSERSALAGSATAERAPETLAQILSVGTSAGGARAKAVIAWNRQTGEVRSGQVDVAAGFEHWLIKFDGVSNNKDRDSLADPQGYGAIEFAYSMMAAEAGIEMSECRLMEEGGRRHFMTKRFDRDVRGNRIHMQSLGAIAHFDFNMAGAHSYEQALTVAREIGLDSQAIEQLFRRMIFNVVARNQDDHVKNIAFLMDRGGRWSLSPAFDVTFAYRPESQWVDAHQMTVNGKRDGFTLEDFRAVERYAQLPRGRSDSILRQVTEVVGEWPRFTQQADVDPSHARSIGSVLRLNTPPR